MSVPKDKKASEKLFALYKKRIVKPPAEEPTNPPVVTATPIPTPAPEEINPQPSPNAVATGTKQPTIPNNDVPIYVFFNKPTDYGQLKPELRGLFIDYVSTNNSTLFNLNGEIDKVAKQEAGSQFSDDRITSFAVLNNGALKHIVLSGNKTISKLKSALEGKEKERIYEIKGETFSFRNDFLQLIKRIHDGQKFLVGETEKSAFTFTWELEVDPVSGKKYNFLNSNGTISSESLPQIQRNKIINELANLKEVLKPKKEKLQKLGQKYDKDFDCSDKSTETIIDNFISKFTQ
jgi:hypothetical protein